jgi:hypothetical protein
MTRVPLLMLDRGLGDRRVRSGAEGGGRLSRGTRASRTPRRSRGEASCVG